MKSLINTSLPILEIPIIQQNEFTTSTKNKSEEMQRKNKICSPRKKMKLTVDLNDIISQAINKENVNNNENQTKRVECEKSERKFFFTEIDLGGYKLIIAPKMEKEMEQSYYTKKNLSKLLKMEYKYICKKEPYLTPTMKFTEKQIKFPSSCTYSNYSLNRYQDVLCDEITKFKFYAENDLNESINDLGFDDLLLQMHNTQKLEEVEKYINANYIKGLHPSNTTFIATQAPLEKTLPEFYEMVWQSNSKVIISLTSLVENNKVKMIPFWPSLKKPLKISHFQIFLKDEIIHHEALISRVFLVKNLTSQEERIVKQIHYTGWPDGDVPKDPSSLIEVYNLQKLYESQGSIYDACGPTIVHCSAGIGRSATYTSFVFAAQILEFLNKEDILPSSRISRNLIIDIPSIVINIRKQRNGSVQNCKQYILIYKSINFFVKNLLSF